MPSANKSSGGGHDGGPPCTQARGRFALADWLKAPLRDYIINQDDNAGYVQQTVDELDDLYIHSIEHNRFSAEDMLYMLEKTVFQIHKPRSTEKRSLFPCNAEKP